MTARKREEDLLLVPMSVAVIPGEQLDAARIDSLYQMQFEVPGLLVINQGLWGARFALRGVSDEGGASLPVTTSLDGVTVDRSHLALTRLFDVERIEILKGPQGTLYGRNSTGGALNILTRRPEDEFAAGIEAAYGSFDTTRVEGRLNLPLRSSALRLAGAVSEGDGYIRNTADERRFAEDDFAAMRAALRLQPGERWTVDLMAQHVEDDGATGELWLPRADYLPDPGDIHLTTVTAEDPFLTIRNTLAKAEVAYESDGYTFVSVSGHAGSTVRNLDDCAGTPELASCERGVQPLVYRQWSQEFRLASTGESRTEWLIGTFLLWSEESTRFFTRLPARVPLPLYDYTADASRQAAAVFGQATRRLGERLSVNAGLRLGRERADLSSVGTGLNDNRAPRDEDGQWNQPSWRLGLEWAATEETLYYLSVSTGFRSGGLSPEYLPPGVFDRYEPETMTALEAGVNLRLPAAGSTLRASAFRYDYRDMQVTSTVLVGNRLRSVIDNAARARICGLDVSGTALVSDSMTLSAGAVWLPERKYLEFSDVLGGADLAGNQLSRAPALTASVAVEYRRGLGRLGTASLRTDYSYRSRYYFTKENDPVASQSAFGLLNVFLRLETPDSRAYVFLAARNLGDVDYFHQVFLQSAPGYPRTFEAGVGRRF